MPGPLLVSGPPAWRAMMMVSTCRHHTPSVSPRHCAASTADPQTQTHIRFSPPSPGPERGLM
eukprot:2991094-Rhodomonas_salina.1